MDIDTDEMTETCRLATIGYDLDGGGYGFGPGEDDWLGMCVLDSGVDYLHWMYEGERHLPHKMMRDLIAVFDVRADVDTMPLLAVVGDAVHVKVTTFMARDTDHDCNCHGVAYDEEETNYSEWDYTGNTNDDPHPDCDRCGGEGTVESPGGAFAFYVPLERLISHLRDSTEAVAGFLLTRSSEGVENEDPHIQVAIDAIHEGRVEDVADILMSGRDA